MNTEKINIKGVKVVGNIPKPSNVEQHDHSHLREWIKFKEDMMKSYRVSLNKYVQKGILSEEDADIIILSVSQKIKFDACPLKCGLPVNPIACLNCNFGHIWHCHYPFRCSDEESNCIKNFGEKK